MKRNCTLDLHFHSSSSYSLSHNSMNEPLNISKQFLHAILHKRSHTLDITELQARMIIWLANQEMEEIKNGGRRRNSIPLLSLQLHALLMHLPQGISIKKSIGSFLEKRKKRFQTHNETN
ncbi:PREDICTED: protein JAZ13-like [Lupinus angustifolius]|uniref:protein JAZ13-like n=1 Tax=Lupinus angustifolius TaxID=3871 RepID=UPI00092E2CB2|nr:PREDICTED: protein JAZ13-like [Lupinus angustifolius]